MTESFVFNYGNVRSALARFKEFSLEAYDELTQLREDLLDALVVAEGDPIIAIALREVQAALRTYERDPLAVNLAKDIYIRNNWQKRIIEQLLDIPEDNPCTRDYFLDNNILRDTRHMWLINRMKYHDSTEHNMYESAKEVLREIIEEELEPIEEVYPDSSEDTPDLIRLKLARYKWLSLHDDGDDEDGLSGDDDE